MAFTGFISFFKLKGFKGSLILINFDFNHPSPLLYIMAQNVELPILLWLKNVRDQSLEC